jgi:hypothetical protein
VELRPDVFDRLTDLIWNRWRACCPRWVPETNGFRLKARHHHTAEHAVPFGAGEAVCVKQSGWRKNQHDFAVGI